MKSIALVLVVALASLAQAAPPDGSQQEGPSSNERKTAEKGTAPKDQKWKSLFDGKSLGKWKVLDEFDYSRRGKVYVRDGRIVLEAGNPATGIRWTGPFPKIDYEVTLEAMRVEAKTFSAP